MSSRRVPSRQPVLRRVMPTDPVLRFRRVALYEGVSFLLLLGIAMPLKYLAGIPLAVRVEGPDLCVSVADMAPFHARADGPVFGQIGLFVSGDTPNPDPVRFRHLRVSDL